MCCCFPGMDLVVRDADMTCAGLGKTLQATSIIAGMIVPNECFPLDVCAWPKQQQGVYLQGPVRRAAQSSAHRLTCAVPQQQPWRSSDGRVSSQRRRSSCAPRPWWATGTTRSASSSRRTC